MLNWSWFRKFFDSFYFKIIQFKFFSTSIFINLSMACLASFRQEIVSRLTKATALIGLLFDLSSVKSVQYSSLSCSGLSFISSQPFWTSLADGSLAGTGTICPPFPIARQISSWKKKILQNVKIIRKSIWKYSSTNDCCYREIHVHLTVVHETLTIISLCAFTVLAFLYERLMRCITWISSSVKPAFWEYSATSADVSSEDESSLETALRIRLCSSSLARRDLRFNLNCGYL